MEDQERSKDEWVREAESLRRQLEELKRREVQTRTLVNNIPCMVYRVEKKGAWTASIFGPWAEKITGYTAEEFLAERSWSDIIHQDDKAVVLKEGADILENPCQIDQEYRILRKDGNVVWVRDIKTSVFEQGAFVSIDGVVMDITEYKKAGEALRRSEQRYKTLLNSSRDAIMTACPRRGMLSGNSATLEMFRCRDEAQFISQSPASLSPEYQPDGMVSSVKAQQMMAAALKEGSHFFEWKHKRLDGEEFYASVLLTRTEIEGERLLLATVRDITRQKEADDELRRQKVALEQKNIALKEILEQIELEKKEIQDNVVANAENLLLPILEKLSTKGTGSKTYIRLLKENLKTLVSSFGRRLTDKVAKLTTKEIEICNMVKNGLSSKEIAGILHISVHTVEKHRLNARKKLGIVHKDLNLSSFLNRDFMRGNHSMA